MKDNSELEGMSEEMVIDGVTVENNDKHQSEYRVLTRFKLDAS
jgi:hypothetical protein